MTIKQLLQQCLVFFLLSCSTKKNQQNVSELTTANSDGILLNVFVNSQKQEKGWIKNNFALKYSLKASRDTIVLISTGDSLSLPDPQEINYLAVSIDNCTTEFHGDMIEHIPSLLNHKNTYWNIYIISNPPANVHITEENPWRTEGRIEMNSGDWSWICVELL